MNDKERRAIVWDEIERIAFRPSSDNDKDAWMGVFARTLHSFWGLQKKQARIALEDNFSVTFLKLKCCYSIKSKDNYVVSLRKDSKDGHQYWQNHIDSRYLSKSSLHSTKGKYPNQYKTKNLKEDIKAVLNGMLFHPRCHTHLEEIGIENTQLDQNLDGLSLHETRVGGGIENPFVFLFHLRYQFCLVAAQVRQDERQRLINLFEKSIKNNNQSVNAKTLFDFKRQ